MSVAHGMRFNCYLIIRRGGGKIIKHVDFFLTDSTSPRPLHIIKHVVVGSPLILEIAVRT